MNTRPAIVWFLNDLRLADNPAIRHAQERGGPIVPLFIWSPEEYGDWTPGAASRWWLYHSLRDLYASLKKCGSGLVVRSGASLDVLHDVIRATNANAVVFNRRYEPDLKKRDEQVVEKLRGDNIEVQSFNAGLLYEPGDVLTNAQQPYKVFTPFWNACLTKPVPDAPLPKPRKLDALPADQWPESTKLNLLADHPWENKLADHWQVTEAGAQENLKSFANSALADYDTGRDLPGQRLTSRLSPYLHFGQISPRQIWYAVSPDEHPPQVKSGPAKSTFRFLAEVGWREFAHHLLHFFPETTTKPLRPEFENFPWQPDEKALRAWQRGRTGFPMVDAGMRELWETGWMHNRVRMIVASFLVKHLLIPWQDGAAWFWDTLVDADLANNTLGWQWTAGCGADAAPFFRIFNPMTQGTKFDEDGAYVRRWVPELSDLPYKWIHQPWEAPADILSDAGVVLGETYPRHIVEHADARRCALDAYAKIKKS